MREWVDSGNGRSALSRNAHKKPVCSPVVRFELPGKRLFLFLYAKLRLRKTQLKPRLRLPSYGFVPSFPLSRGYKHAQHSLGLTIIAALPVFAMTTAFYCERRTLNWNVSKQVLEMAVQPEGLANMFWCSVSSQAFSSRSLHRRNEWRLSNVHAFHSSQIKSLRSKLFLRTML